ncbi:MAG: Peptidase [Pelosinus sp.]|jgi:murein DD-endopeptidase MepM/ murein hydrolase activator NlpD|nr:Peptidase [Pelosinus sp.]
MSKLKMPALSFITLHLKRINASLYKQGFSQERIPFKTLYGGVGLFVLASILVASVLLSIHSKGQNIVIIPQQDAEQQVVVPAQVLPTEKVDLPQTIPDDALQTVSSQRSSEEPSSFREIKGEVKVNFGWYLHSLYKDWRFHTGIDVLGIEGQIVPAIHGGQVIDIYQDDNSGLTVVVKHNNYQVYYGSLSKITVEKGSLIHAGQGIGKMGNCTGEPYYHLHLAIKKNNDYIDPLLVINKE